MITNARKLKTLIVIVIKFLQFDYAHNLDVYFTQTDLYRYVCSSNVIRVTNFIILFSLVILRLFIGNVDIITR